MDLRPRRRGPFWTLITAETGSLLRADQQSMLVFAFASVIFWGRQALHMPVHQSLCIQTLTGAVLFGVAALPQGDGLAPPLTANFAIGMACMVLIAIFATYFVYYTGLRLFPVAKVSATIYLSPPDTRLDIPLALRLPGPHKDRHPAVGADVAQKWLGKSEQGG